MSETITLRKWDGAPKASYDFAIATKLTDLGVPDKLKTVYGYYINVGVRNRPG